MKKNTKKNEKPVVSYRMTYRLLEKDFDNPGRMKDFDPDKKEYVGYIVAPTAKKTEEQLREDYRMLTVEVVGKPERVEVSHEEYDRN